MLAQPVLRWLTDAEAMLRFERSYAQRFQAYLKKVGNLIQTRTVDPGDWMEEYAYFMQRVLDDAGDWMLGRDPSLGKADSVIPFYRTQLRRSEGTTSISMRIPPMAFEGLDGRDPQVVLTIPQDFRARGGGVNLPRSHFRFVPANVKRSEPRTQLKIFDVRNVVGRGNVYHGTVMTRGQQRFVGVVEVEVQ